MLEGFSLPGNFALFAGAAAVVWLAGTRIAAYADAIATATGIGRAVVGMVLLGAVTSLPEMAVAATASLAGVPALTVNDLLGSAAINVLIVALADAVLGRDAITSVLASPAVLLQGVLGIILLAMVVGATMTIDVPLLGASAWTWLLLFAYAASVAVIASSKSARAWTPLAHPRQEAPAAMAHEPRPLRPLLARLAIAAAAVLVAGFLLAKSAEAIALQSGLGTSFVGAVLLAAATSLPEASTVVAAVRLGRYELAIADVFGTNLFNVTIIFAVDLLYDGGPVLAQVGPFAGFGALLAIVLTALFLAGMIERRDRSFARMGFDSLAALAAYGAGIVLLYHLR